jgi:hypothetical protein
MGDQPIARPLPTQRTTQTQNKRTQTFIPRVGFEPTIPVFERAKTVHALNLAATVIGGLLNRMPKKVINTQSKSYKEMKKKSSKTQNTKKLQIKRI